MTETAKLAPARIFVDVTETVHLDLRTGIQRVVREITRKDSAADDAFAIVPVIAVKGRFFRLSSEGETRLRAPGPAHHVDAQPYRAPLHLAIVRTLLSPFPGLVSKARRWLAERRFERGLEVYIDKEVLPARGDRVVLADTYFQSTAVQAARSAQRRGAAVIVVTYDLIPIQFPHLMEENFRAYFLEKVPRTMAAADGVLTISDFCVDELRKFGVTVPIGRFYLGYDIPLGQKGVREEDADVWPTGLWDNGSPLFLMIGTIASHKGHGIALDAFERLWALGVKCRLLMVGRPGWEVDTLIRRLNEHPERGRHLFLVHDADDLMVDDAFRRSFAGINGSMIEGFGLPLVEALARGLPVIASDIPIFREIAGDAVLSFEQGNSDALAAAIQEMMAKREEYARKARCFNWIDWDGAREAFVLEAERLAGEAGK